MTRSIAALLIAMVSIQSGAALAKQLFPLIGSQATTMLRLGFAALILCLLWRPWKTTFSKKEIRSLLIYGTSLGVMNLTFYLALERIPLGIAVALEFTGPLAVAFFTSRKPLDFIWVAFAMAGMILILPFSQSTASLDPVGIIYALGAGICWALYIIFGQKAGFGVHGGTATALGMLTAALVVLPAGLINSDMRLLDWSILPIALGVAVFSSALPYSLEMVALKKLPTQTFSILMSLEPAIAALSGLLFLKERLTLTQWTAIFLVIVASVGISGHRKKAKGIGNHER